MSLAYGLDKQKLGRQCKCLHRNRPQNTALACKIATVGTTVMVTCHRACSPAPAEVT